MKTKFLFLKDSNNRDLAVNVARITHLQKVSTGDGRARTYVNFTGGSFVEVVGSVDDVANEIRMHSR